MEEVEKAVIFTDDLSHAKLSQHGDGFNEYVKIRFLWKLHIAAVTSNCSQTEG